VTKATIYSGSIGLNNKVLPHRLPFDGKGVSALETATDFVIGRNGEAVTRRGISLAESGAFHSMYQWSGGFYVVKDRNEDSALYFVRVSDSGDLSLSGVRSGLSQGAKIDYAPLGDKLFYSNGYERGYLTVSDGSEAWPTNTARETTREMVSLPVPKHLDLLSGRMVVSSGDEIFYSEYGKPGIYDAVKSRRHFETDVIMVYAVSTGVFVSQTDSVWFVSGVDPSPSTLTARKVLEYPAVEYCRVPGTVNPMDYGFDSSLPAALFGTIRGPVVGFQDGTCINLIDNNVTMPDCGTHDGAIMVVDDSLILQT